MKIPDVLQEALQSLIDGLANGATELGSTRPVQIDKKNYLVSMHIKEKNK